MSTPDPLSPDLIRGWVAELLDEPPETLGEQDDLLDLGLDSVRLMTLVERFRAAGHEVDFADLAEKPTIAAWVALGARV